MSKILVAFEYVHMCTPKHIIFSLKGGKNKEYLVFVSLLWFHSQYFFFPSTTQLFFLHQNFYRYPVLAAFIRRFALIHLAPPWLALVHYNPRRFALILLVSP